MKNSIFIFSIIALLALQSCEDIFNSNCEPVTGDVIEQEIALAPFSKISVEIAANVFISKGETQEVRIEAAESIINEIETDVNNGEWDIEFDNCLKQRNNQTVKIYITVPALEAVGLSGSGDITLLDTFEGKEMAFRISGSGNITGKFIGESLKCSVSGSGDIFLSGSTETQSINISGSGDIWSYNMPALETNISISGSGMTKVYPSEKLDVSISGSGDIYYKGNPTISQSISGSGRLVNEN